ncbi:bcl-2 10 [Sigmodon hispidus]
MEDQLLDRTRRLLTDYLTFCAQEPGAPEPPPTSVEAALLRSVAAHIQHQHRFFFSPFMDYQGNRLELVTQMADALLFDDQSFNWGRLVLLLTFAGTLLNQGSCKAIRRRNVVRNQIQVVRDCHLLVDLLCNRLLGQHRSWLEARDGWDGFCRFFKSPLPLSFWRRLLIKAFLSCIITTAILYIWKNYLKVLKF